MYNELSTLITTERLKMSERNRDHFDIESEDHLKRLLFIDPNEREQLKASLLHRIQLHKDRSMFLVPPMLFPFPGESDADHLKREYRAGGFHEVPFSDFADGIVNAVSENLGIDRLELVKPIPTETEKEQFLFEGLENVNLPL